MSKILAKFSNISSLHLATIIFFATIIVYINTLSNGLFYDDEDFIYKNSFITSFSNLPKFFSQNLIAGAGKVSNYYRPVLEITYALIYSLFDLSPFAYHFVSFLLHAASAVLLFILLYKLFQNKFVAFFTALLFGIHPIQTEAVSYASGMSDPLSMFFVLLSLLFSLSDNTKKYILSLVFFTVALFSRELSIITPLLIIIIHITYHKSLSKKAIVKAIQQSIPFFVIAGIYVLLRLTVLNFQNTLNFYGGHNIYTDNLLIRLNTFLNLLPQYTSLLIYPKTLFIERPATVFVSITPATIIALASIIGFLIASIKYFKQFPILFFSFLWFLISFIPTSGIIPINGIFYEHFAYFPSIGFFTLVSFGTYYVLTKLPEQGKLAALTVIGIYIVLLGIRTIQRNRDWHDPITFYTQTLTYTQTPRLLNNLAMSYADNGNVEKSIEIYKKAVAAGDFYPNTHYNLANSYGTLGKLSDAEKEYKEALRIDPSFYLSYLKLFELYKTTNNKAGEEWVLGEVTKLASQNKSFAPLLLQLKQTE